MKDARKINIGEEPKEQGSKILFFKDSGGGNEMPLKRSASCKEEKKKHAHINDNWKCHFARRSHGG